MNTETLAAPVFALHGTASTSRQWQALSEESRLEQRLIAPDIAGYGREGLADLSATPGLASRCETLRALLQAQPSPVHLLGHSFGGALALSLAAACAEKVLSVSVYEPTALTVFHASDAPEDIALTGDIRRLADITQHASGAVAMESFINFWMGGNHWQYLAPEVRNRLAGYSKIAARDFQDALTDLDSPQPPKWYTGPVQILVGADSVPISRRIGELLAGHLAGAELHHCEGLGHMGPIAGARSVNEKVLAFAARHDRSLPLGLM